MVVTKDLPGTRWIDILTAANIRVEVCAHEDFILSQNTIKTLISDGCRQCHGVIGQLTEVCSLCLSSVEYFLLSLCFAIYCLSVLDSVL